MTWWMIGRVVKSEPRRPCRKTRTGEYVRILHLAASTTERSVEDALRGLLESGAPFDYAAVKAVAHPDEPSVPTVTLGIPDFASYDELLIAGAAS